MPVGAAGSNTPAIWRPELNTYWFNEPRGQKPPPAVELPVESVQTWPLDRMPQETRLPPIADAERAKSRKPRPR